MRQKSLDKILAFTILGLVIFGLIMISSVSVYESHQITEQMAQKGLMEAPTNSFYLWRHFWRVIIAIPLGLFAIVFPLMFWKKGALLFFILSLLLLIAVFLPGIGAGYGTSTSWIDIPFIPSLQPAEFVKLALIFYLALWMEKRQELVMS